MSTWGSTMEADEDVNRFEGVTDWYQSHGYREPAVMSSASSAVTYTSVYTNSEPGRAFWGADDEEISKGGILRAQRIHRHRQFLKTRMSVSLCSKAHDLDYVPEPIYPEYIPLEDEHELPAEEQPLPPVDSPTAESPEYVTESDPDMR
ncbi:hypothetical protein Tco_0033167 [Tanacetum coccineum]